MSVATWVTEPTCAPVAQRRRTSATDVAKLSLQNQKRGCTNAHPSVRRAEAPISLGIGRADTDTTSHTSYDVGAEGDDKWRGKHRWPVAMTPTSPTHREAQQHLLLHLTVPSCKRARTRGGALSPDDGPAHGNRGTPAHRGRDPDPGRRTRNGPRGPTQSRVPAESPRRERRLQRPKKQEVRHSQSK